MKTTKITKMKAPTTNTANTTPSGKDSAPLSKMTKTKTNMNKKTTVARIPVLELLVVDLVVNIIPVALTEQPLVRRVPSVALTEPQSPMHVTQMRSQIMINLS